MSSEWQYYKFSVLVNKIVGGGTPSKDIDGYWNGDINWASVKDLKEETYFLLETEDKITKYGLDNSSSNLIPKNNILLATRIGVGKCCINRIDTSINQDLKALLCNKEVINPSFLLYVLKSMKDYFELIGFGTTVKGIRLEQLLEMKIYIPSLSTQKKIAGVLAAFDELIEVNRRKIKILEEMAQAIYKEWFVKMKFPGHKKFAPPIGNGDGTAPYRVFDSPLGPIPEGWEVKNLRDFGTVVTGKTPPKNEVEYYGSYMPFIKIPDMHEYPFCIKTSDNLSEKGVSTQKNKILPPNSLCVSCIGTAGLVTITTVQSMTNQQINSLIINNFMLREFLYFALLNLKGLIELYGMNGATMTNLNKSKFENLEIIYPSKEVLISFNSNEKPIFDLIKSFEYSIDYLSSLRDLLLPKLISGKIDVSELDIDQYALGDS